MTITAFPRVARSKKTGQLYLAVNADNGCSVCWTATWGFAPYGKGSTQGQRNVEAAFHAALRDHKVAEGADMTRHAEEKVAIGSFGAGGWTLAITDVAEVGGVSVGSDGAYLVNAQGEIFELNFWD